MPWAQSIGRIVRLSSTKGSITTVARSGSCRLSRCAVGKRPSWYLRRCSVAPRTSDQRPWSRVGNPVIVGEQRLAGEDPDLGPEVGADAAIAISHIGHLDLTLMALRSGQADRGRCSRMAGKT